jgi:hypothetical protein
MDTTARPGGMARISCSVEQGRGRGFEVAVCDLERWPGRRRYAPYVFTEQGVAMLSSVLRSKRAVAVNIAIMCVFVELRRAAASYAAIEQRLAELERETQAKLGRHDQQLDAIFGALRELISPPAETQAEDPESAPTFCLQAGRIRACEGRLRRTPRCTP